MGVLWRLVPGDITLCSKVFKIPVLSPDSKTLRSESESFATRARGSCGMEPGPVWLRMETFPKSSIGDWLYGVRKRLMRVGSSMFSNFASLRFTEFTVCGGGTDLALMRPRKGSSGHGVAGVFEGMAPSSAYIR
jgi:hypothetical protein